MFHAEPHAGQVGRNNPVPVLLAALGGLLDIPLDTGVVQGAVQTAIGAHGLLDQGGHLRRLGDIGTNEPRRSAGRLDHTDRLLSAVLIHVGNNNPGAFSGKNHRRGAPNARAATSHQRYSCV